jgi:hypothetical protein
MTDQIKQHLRDIHSALALALQGKELTDTVRAAMSRLRDATATVSPAQQHDALKAQRSQLIVQRFRLADKARDLLAIAAAPNAHWSAQRAADSASAEHEACCIKLAEVEAALTEAAA